jgi:hypothetical protein
MNANLDLEHRLTDHYASEVPPRAPDRVLEEALASIDATPQRRVLIRAPWRFPVMNSYFKWAIAALVVIAVGAVGLSVLRPPSPSGVGGQPSASPSLSPSPTFGATIIPEPAPALTETFTSDRHGFSISYPSGWDTQAASAPATSAFPIFGTPEGDFMFDPVLLEHLFIVVTSRPLAGQDGAAWANEVLNELAAANDCSLPLESITIDGGPGVRCGPGAAATWRGDRGYVILLHTSGDDPPAVAAYDEEFFADVLATMKLRPENAVDATPSPSP